MTIQGLLEHYGALALFVGCLLEGETVAIAGGVLAHTKVIALWKVLLAVALGAFGSDSMFFLIGRRFRDNAFVTRNLARRGIIKIMQQVDKNPGAVASLYRFVPGTRILGPLALARSPISTVEFLVRAGLAVMAWTATYILAGHAISAFTDIVLGEGHPIEKFAVVIVFAVVLTVAFLIRRRNKRRVIPLVD